MAFIVQYRYTNLLRVLREAENRAWDSTNLSKGKIYFFPPHPIPKVGILKRDQSHSEFPRKITEDAVVLHPPLFF